MCLFACDCMYIKLMKGKVDRFYLNWKHQFIFNEEIVTLSVLFIICISHLGIVLVLAHPREQSSATRSRSPMAQARTGDSNNGPILLAYIRLTFLLA